MFGYHWIFEQCLVLLGVTTSLRGFEVILIIAGIAMVTIGFVMEDK